VSTAARAGDATPPAAAPPLAAPPELRKVNAGYVPALSFAPIFVAYEKGYYREQGLEVDLQTLTGGTDMVTQTASGNFDVGAGSPGAGLFNALARGIQLKFVAPVSIFKPPDSTPLIGSKALQDRGELHGIADLRGQRVSIISRGAASEYFLDQALRRGGLTIRDVDLQTLPGPDAVAALANESIAAGNIAEPNASEAIDKGVGVVLNNDYADNVLAIIMYFNEGFAQARREDGIRLLTGFYRAVRDLEPSYHDDDLQIIAQYTHLSPQTIRSAARPYHDPGGNLRLGDMEAMQRFSIAQGDTTYNEPLGFARFADSSFTDAALQRLAAVPR
jgi:NitT/TauT family transport system substrate-binding protein